MKQLLRELSSGAPQSIWNSVYRIDVIFVFVWTIFNGYSTPLTYSAVMTGSVSFTILPTIYCTIGILLYAHFNGVEMAGVVREKHKTYQLHHNCNGQILSGWDLTSTIQCRPGGFCTVGELKYVWYTLGDYTIASGLWISQFLHKQIPSNSLYCVLGWLVTRQWAVSILAIEFTVIFCLCVSRVFKTLVTSPNFRQKRCSFKAPRRSHSAILPFGMSHFSIGNLLGRNNVP